MSRKHQSGYTYSINLLELYNPKVGQIAAAAISGSKSFWDLFA
ncbi:MAG TPA: hypothetical protein VER14_00675 [Phototrophicaceae bacterium]|nr:hypothetical protein [Phototrophicaceae bacterium]